MTYLLDTDVIINHIHGKDKLALGIFQKGSAISICTYVELFYGVARSSAPRENRQVIEEFLKNLAIDILPFDQRSSNVFVQLKLDLRESPLDDFDLIIAATAVVYDLTLVTKNVKHFERIKGLEILK